MRSPRSAILMLLAGFGFVVLSLTPRGMALCIGGGHELTEALAGWCEEHGGHVHAAQTAEAHDHDACPDGHHHDEHSEPCADIPLGLKDCRLQVSDQVIDVSMLMPAALMAIPAIALPEAADELERAWRAAWSRASAQGPPTAEQRSLRAVVLLI